MELLGILEGHSSAIYTLSISDKSGTVLSGAADNMVGSWSIEDLRPDNFSIRLEHSVFSLLLIDNYFLVGEAAGGVHVVDLVERNELRHLKFHTLPVFSILHDVNRQMIYFIGGDGKLSIVNDEDFSLKWSLPLSEEKLRCGLIHSQASLLLVGSSDGYIRVLETSYFNVIYDFSAHPGGVYDMKWAGGNQFISVGRDGHIRKWRLEDNKVVMINEIPAHNYAIYGLEFSPNGSIFATCSRDKKVKIWKSSDLSFIEKIERNGPIGHTHSVNAIMWYDDHTLLSAGDDRKIFVWNIKDS
ncbi:MAG: hypothetical protein AAGC47_02160 [Bacteroidota bacterium]